MERSTNGAMRNRALEEIQEGAKQGTGASMHREKEEYEKRDGAVEFGKKGRNGVLCNFGIENDSLGSPLHSKQRCFKASCL